MGLLKGHDDGVGLGFGWHKMYSTKISGPRAMTREGGSPSEDIASGFGNWHTIKLTVGINSGQF
jgi:hypothetical protein